jgi:hypothetical protein
MAKKAVFNGIDKHFESDMWLYMQHEVIDGQVVFTSKPQALLFDIVGEYQFSIDRVKAAHTACIKAARDSLANNESVVVSNTFTQMWEMQPYLNAAKEFGATVEIITATGNYGSIHNVPESAIQAMRERWEEVAV